MANLEVKNRKWIFDFSTGNTTSQIRRKEAYENIKKIEVLNRKFIKLGLNPKSKKEVFEFIENFQINESVYSNCEEMIENKLGVEINKLLKPVEEKKNSWHTLDKSNQIYFGDGKERALKIIYDDFCNEAYKHPNKQVVINYYLFPKRLISFFESKKEVVGKEYLFSDNFQVEIVTEELLKKSWYINEHRLTLENIIEFLNKYKDEEFQKTKEFVVSYRYLGNVYSAPINKKHKFKIKRKFGRKRKINVSFEKPVLNKRMVDESNEQELKFLDLNKTALERFSKEKIMEINPQDFEKQTQQLLEIMGYKTKLTPYTSDGGVDVIAEKDEIKYYVQCKHYNKNNPVTASSVRELHGVASADNAKTIFVTTSYFTKESLSFGKRVGMLMIDGVKLESEIRKALETDKNLK